MGKGKKGIRICLFCVVLIAIVVGVFYYYYQMHGEQDDGKGTLIANISSGMKSLCP